MYPRRVGLPGPLGTVPGVTSVKELAGAVALGLGAIFGNRRADQHWSERPTVELEEEEEVGTPSGNAISATIGRRSERLANITRGAAGR